MSPVGSDLINIVLGIATLLGLVLTILFYFIPPFRRKKLTYGIVSSTAIISHNRKEGITTTFGEKLEIKFNGNAVDNVYVTIIKVRNTGNVEVKSKQEPGKPLINFVFEPKILGYGKVNEDSEISDATFGINSEQNISLSSLNLEKKIRLH